jgi:hypothetical protein
MAYVLTDVGVFVGGFDLTDGAASIEMGGTCAMLERPNFGSKGHMQFLPGLKTFNTEVGGLADYGSVTAVSNAFKLNAVGNQQVVTGLPNVSGTHAAGDPAHFTRALRSSFQSPQGAVGDVARYAISMMSDTPMVDGSLLFPKAAVTSSSTGTVVAMAGPTASQYLYAGLHVFDVSGTSPTLDVKIQSAALVGFGSPTDRVTFTQATGSSANTSQWATPLAGAITDGFWRVSYTVGGSSTPTFQFAVVAGVLTVT